MLKLLKHITAFPARQEPLYDEVTAVSVKLKSSSSQSLASYPYIDMYRCHADVVCEVSVTAGEAGGAGRAVAEASRRIKLAIFGGLLDRMFKLERLLADRKITEAIKEVRNIQREITGL